MTFNRWHWMGRMVLLVGLCSALGAEAEDLTNLLHRLNGPRAAGRPRRASIIFVECDSLGYLDLSCYGQKQFQTPNLDRLAAGGMLFTNFECGGADVAQSRAALLLGHDAGFAPANVPAGATTIGQVLRAGGVQNGDYQTGFMGEWDLGGQGSGSAPWEKGFNNFVGYFAPAEATDYFADHMWRYQPMGVLNTNNNHWETYVGAVPLMKNAGGAQGEYIPDLYTYAMLNFIKEYRPMAFNHYRPFFLWVNYPTARPNEAEAARTGNGLQVPTDAPYSEEKWPQPEKNKAAMISRLDGDIGELLDSLKAKNMTNNAAIFFFSGTVPRRTGGIDPLFFPSVTSTNDVRLPMIAYWPGHIPAGSVSGFHCTPANLLATAAEIGMESYPTNEVGTSLLPILYGKSLTNAPAGK